MTQEEFQQQISTMLKLGNRLLLSQQQRSVTTTSSSKIQQAAAQQPRNQHHSEQPQQTSSSKDQFGNTSSNDPTQSVEKYKARLDNLRLWHSIETIKKLSHRLVQLDPLDRRPRETLNELAGWNQELINQIKSESKIVPTRGFLDTKQPLMAINELVDTVWNIYAEGQCGLEFAHMTNQEEIEWLTSHWEKLNEIFHLDHLEQHNLAKLMLECEAFDHFMAAKFPTVKRYGCEGAESMLVVLDETLRLCHLGATDLDEMTKLIGRIDDVIIGMPHRGRLNLLACLLGFEPMAIFNKTRGEPELDLSKAWMATGDVLSHLSVNTRFVYGLDRGHHIGLSRDTPDPINVTLLPNPSHLEVVSPVTVGTARGRAHNILHAYSSSPKFITFNSKFKAAKHSDNVDYSKYYPTILPIQIHGDASVSGQGIIQETLQMANLPQFQVGGSLHLIVNNQIGYTTDCKSGRSTRHCTDIFKMIEAPVIHVNAQNIASVVRATRLALTYRQKFNKDIAIDLVCYRRHGHNEMDEPSFTQPQMYNNIRERQSIPQTFCDEIGMDEMERKQITDDYKGRLQEAYKKSERYKPDNDDYRNFKLPTEFHRDHICSWQTGCDLETLRSIALDSVSIPDNFNIHPNLERVLIKERQTRFGSDESNSDNKKRLEDVKVDWATAEILAFGSLLKQNHSVRLAGQDVARGTFSTRHAILYDQKTEQPYCPLNESMKRDSSKQKAQLEVANTILSEEAALAYEYGYSAETCELSIWEAQFGDFFNTAQSIIDTLVSSSESKWLKQSPLTLLLPHGLDGAGPEHSSSHLERFLQMCSSSSSPHSIDTEAKVNWSICFPTMPSQYFHLLRRQVLRPFRKPLIVMSPKVIFRHPECQSSLLDFAEDSQFEPVLDDPSLSKPAAATTATTTTTAINKSHVDTIILCSGKVYFQLNEMKRQEQMCNVALIRLEELCPFPIQALVHTLRSYPNVHKSKMFWFQEEHKNQGAYQFVDCRLKNMANIKLNYLGRPESELPATGSSALHKRELEHLMKQFRSLKTSASVADAAAVSAFG